MLVVQARSRLAHAVKDSKRRPGKDATERVAAARRDLAAAKLEAYTARVLAEAPGLSTEIQQKLTVLLHGGQTFVGPAQACEGVSAEPPHGPPPPEATTGDALEHAADS